MVRSGGFTKQDLPYAAMIYREYTTTPALATVGDCVWTLDGHAREMADAQPVLPDGRPEIILHLGDPFDHVHRDGDRERQAPVIFAGQLLRPLDLRATGRVAVVGIRLRPHGAAALFAEPQDRLVGHTAGLDTSPPCVWRAAADRAVRTFVARAGNARYGPDAPARRRRPA